MNSIFPILLALLALSLVVGAVVVGGFLLAEGLHAWARYRGELRARRNIAALAHPTASWAHAGGNVPLHRGYEAQRRESFFKGFPPATFWTVKNGTVCQVDKSPLADPQG